MSEYHKALKKLVKDISAHDRRAILKLYDLVMQEGYSPQQARAQLEVDLRGHVTHINLISNLPDEANRSTAVTA
jgi:peroxiredoxin